MSNKLSLIVNFLGVDKMSGALRNIVGLGRRGSSSIRSLTGESRKLERELAKVRRELSGATGNVTELMNRERALERSIASTNEQLARRRRHLAIAADRQAMLNRAQEMRGKGAEGMLAGAAMAVPLIAATKQAMTFESAMADVRKVVDFPNPQAFAKMSDDVLDLSTRIPMAAEGIAAIVAAAGRANIPRKELLGFAQDAAKMGVAFDMSGDEAGAMMAKWRTAFAMNQDGVNTLSNQINALTNAYGGTATDVSGIVTRIGALGKVAGVTAPQVAAMAQLLNSVGVEEEVAATGIKNMMLALTKGDAATKSQAESLKTLGLNATDLADRMQKDAGGAITDVLQRLSKVPKAQQAGILTNLFGSESVSAIAPMLTNLDKLQTNLALVADKSKYAGSMEKEYLSAIATSEGATGLAMNALKGLNITLGQQLLPTVMTVSRQVVSAANSVRAWAKAHPQLTSFLVKTVGALIAFRFGLGAAKFAVGGLLGPFARILPYFRKVDGISRFGRHLGVFARLSIQAGGLAMRGFGLVRGAAMLLARGVVRAGLIMMANPIVLAITLIVLALAGAAYLIYTHWDKISAAFTAGVAWVKGKLQGLPDWLKNIGSMMMQGLLLAINPMALAWKLLDVAKNGVTAFRNYLGIKSPSRLFMAMGGHVAGGLERGIDENRHGPVRAIGRMASGVAAAGAVSLTPMNAAASPSGGGQGGGGGFGPIELHIHGTPGMNVDELADAAFRKFERKLAQRGRSEFKDR
ncbi:phage tail tape measure protein [Novosphingobium sp. 11B]